jgi:cob(I)alamin adenosyltransferase
VKIYTRDGDDGTTGLYFGGRVTKDAGQIELNGLVDEAQAALGVARSLADRDSTLDEMLIAVERDLWILMAEVATAPENRRKLKPGQSLVTEEMVLALESRIDRLAADVEVPKEFVVPGDNQLAASLDLARTVVRRAERTAVSVAAPDGEVLAYLNRLSDLVWMMARYAEGPKHRIARDSG